MRRIQAITTRLRLVLVVGLVAAAVPTTAEATPVPTVSCRSPLGRTLHANNLVRVFTYRPPPEEYARTWSCYRGQRTARFLGDRGGPFLWRLAINRQWVAVALKYSTGQRGPVFYSVELLNARTGRSQLYGGSPEFLKDDKLNLLNSFSGLERGIIDLVLTNRGSAAWMITPPDDFPGAPATLMVAGPGRKNAVFDQATDLDLDSLALSSNEATLYWLRAGQLHAAPMAGSEGQPSRTLPFARTSWAGLPCEAPGQVVSASPNSLVTRRLGVAYYACTRGHSARAIGSGRGDFGDNSGVQHLALAGHYVATVSRLCGKGDCYGTVELRDLRTSDIRRVTLEHATGIKFEALVTSPSGVAAWITTSPTGTELHRLGMTSPDVLLDGGPIDLKSLALGGNSIYWRKTGEVRVAALK